MFRIIGRIILILAVAAIIAGGIYALVQNSSSGTSSDVRPEPQFANQGTTNGSQPQEFREGDRFEGGASIGRGLAGVIGSILKISLITLIVLVVRKWLGRGNKLPQPV